MNLANYSDKTIELNQLYIGPVMRRPQVQEVHSCYKGDSAATQLMGGLQYNRESFSMKIYWIKLLSYIQ